MNDLYTESSEMNFRVESLSKIVAGGNKTSKLISFFAVVLIPSMVFTDGMIHAIKSGKSQ